MHDDQTLTAEAGVEENLEVIRRIVTPTQAHADRPAKKDAWDLRISQKCRSPAEAYRRDFRSSRIAGALRTRKRHCRFDRLDDACPDTPPGQSVRKALASRMAPCQNPTIGLRRPRLCTF